MVFLKGKLGLVYCREEPTSTVPFFPPMVSDSYTLTPTKGLLGLRSLYILNSTEVICDLPCFGTSTVSTT